jgi:sugar lactone lactonase YvrE
VAEVVLWSTTAGLLSEGPRWHEEAGELLWVDILGATFHRGTPIGLWKPDCWPSPLFPPRR